MHKEATKQICAIAADELAEKMTERYTNYVNMGMIAEAHALNEVVETSEMLRELNEQDNRNLKKTYNFKLVDKLELLEGAWQVRAEFRNG